MDVNRNLNEKNRSQMDNQNTRLVGCFLNGLIRRYEIMIIREATKENPASVPATL